MKTKDLADWLGVDTSTIRLWTSRDYRVFLSPTAQGGDGQQRRFHDQDARIVALIASLRSEGVVHKDIHDTLARLQAEDWRDLPPMPAAPPGYGPVPMIPREAAETAVSTQRAALMREIAILQERVETLEDLLDAQRQQYFLDLTKEREGRETERNQLQTELLRAKEDLGELRGKLHGLTGERQLWLRGMIAVAIVAAVLLVVVVIVVLNLVGVGIG